MPKRKNQLRYQIKRQHNNTIQPQSQVQKSMNPFLQQHDQKPQQGQNISVTNDNDIFAMIREFADK